MKMNKMFAGLIAFVAGVALSAGSAFAQGYTTGDPAMMKLIPYYETGDTTATIIGIQNMSGQEQDTKNKNQAVKELQDFLAGEPATQGVVNNTTGVEPDTVGDYLSGTNSPTAPVDPTTKANAEKALEDAQKAAYVEHLYITANVYDAMGMMMDDASASLCLAENQFGVVVLQGAIDDMMMDGSQMQVLSVADEEIPANGYVEVVAEGTKYNTCDFSSRLNPPVTVDTRPDPSQGTKTDTEADSMIATWAIIQDTGDGFFGTEVQSATLSTAKNTSADATAEVACYSTPAANAGTATLAPFTQGSFSTSRCGLIPERSNQGNGVLNSDGSTTDSATAYARYDAGDESMIYVWLAAGQDNDTTKPKDSRNLTVTIRCEEGTVVSKKADSFGDLTLDITVPAPNKLTMIDPMAALGDQLDECEGDRGVLAITMPNGSRAGMVFSHVTQMMGHYRMNFPGYNTISSEVCTDDSTTSCL